MYINEKINTANEISQKYKDILVRKAIIKAIYNMIPEYSHPEQAEKFIEYLSDRWQDKEVDPNQTTLDFNESND